jgi:hypothetical protein
VQAFTFSGSSTISRNGQFCGRKQRNARMWTDTSPETNDIREKIERRRLERINGKLVKPHRHNTCTSDQSHQYMYRYAAVPAVVCPSITPNYGRLDSATLQLTSHPSSMNWSSVFRIPHRLQARMPRMADGTDAWARSTTFWGSSCSCSSSMMMNEQFILHVRHCMLLLACCACARWNCWFRNDAARLTLDARWRQERQGMGGY